ncbi:MAG: bifunctional DNA-formamidopyrimidine glycosylase/DNA-(apurinic or apyrimidinic site) lyase [Alphaproteobacteria bacterium]
MPELPEVETVRLALEAGLAGRRFACVKLRRADLRFPFPPGLGETLAGRRIARFGRRAKYLLLHLDDGGVLIAHLGMSGRMRVSGPAEAARLSPPGKHDHVIFTMDDGTEWRFNDARRFGLLDYALPGALAEHRFFRALGPEPIGLAGERTLSGAILAPRLKGKRTPIKAALLDQRVIAGLGNIYVCEALFRAGLSPRRQAASVQGKRADRLAGAIHDVLVEAIGAGGSSLRDHVSPTGELGYFQHRFAVYGRAGETCPDCRCGRVIRRIVQSGRSTFYCAERQR